MGKRPAPDNAQLEVQAAAAQDQDQGILADHSSEEDGVSDVGSGSEQGLNESGSDADAEGGSSSADEAAASSEDDPPAAAVPQTAADAADIDAEAPDSDIDAGLDELGHQSTTTSNSDDEDLSDHAAADSDLSSDRDDDPSTSPGSKQQHVSFLEGGKSASFAKAFRKIMAKPSKAAGSNAAAAADVILSESVSMAKRKAEVDADEAAAREAKRQRLELKTRGHLKVPRKGADPSHDAREKQLQKLATRGVVLLFNAVNKAQKQKREAEAAGLKGAKALKAKPGLSSKAGFFAELKAGAQQAVADLNPSVTPGNEQLVPGVPEGLGKVRNPKEQRQQQQQSQGRGSLKGPAAAAPGAAVAAGGAGWDVLSAGFPGLTGGVKMKDWDKSAVSDEEMNGQALAGSDGGSDGDEGW